MSRAPLSFLRTSSLSVLLVALAGCAGGDGVTNELDGYVHLFSTIDAPASPPAIADEPWAVRVAAVEIDARMFDQAAIAAGDTLVVELFDGERMTASVETVNHVTGHRNVRARVVEGEEGAVLLSVGRETVSGSIRLSGRANHYYVRHAPDIGSHVLVEVDATREDVVPEAPPEEWP